MSHPDMIEPAVPLMKRRHNKGCVRPENEVFAKLQIGESTFFPASDPQAPEAVRANSRLSSARYRLRDRKFAQRWRTADDEASDGLPAQSGYRVWRIK